MKGIFRELSVPTFVAVVAFIFVDKLVGTSDWLVAKTKGAGIGRSDPSAISPTQTIE